MKLVSLLIIALAFFTYRIYVESSYETVPGPIGEGSSNLIMYSLTTCGYCTQKRKELHRERIRFTEYFIDSDRNREKEMTQKLASAGFPPGGYGTPIFEVYGVMMPNNPPLRDIKKELARGIQRSQDRNKDGALANYTDYYAD